MKKTIDPELQPEYDFSGGQRGRYAVRVAAGTNVVVLDKDVHELFPNSVAVNAALRALAQAMAVARKPARPKAPARKRASA